MLDLGTPDDFRGQPYAWLTNQMAHVLAGLAGAWLLMRFGVPGWGGVLAAALISGAIEVVQLAPRRHRIGQPRRLSLRRRRRALADDRRLRSGCSRSSPSTSRSASGCAASSGAPARSSETSDMASPFGPKATATAEADDLLMVTRGTGASPRSREGRPAGGGDRRAHRPRPRRQPRLDRVADRRRRGRRLLDPQRRVRSRGRHRLRWRLLHQHDGVDDLRAEGVGRLARRCLTDRAAGRRWGAWRAGRADGWRDGATILDRLRCAPWWHRRQRRRLHRHRGQGALRPEVRRRVGRGHQRSPAPTATMARTATTAPRSNCRPAPPTSSGAIPGRAAGPTSSRSPRSPARTATTVRRGRTAAMVLPG